MGFLAVLLEILRSLGILWNNMLLLLGSMLTYVAWKGSFHFHATSASILPFSCFPGEENDKFPACIGDFNPQKHMKVVSWEYDIPNYIWKTYNPFMFRNIWRDYSSQLGKIHIFQSPPPRKHQRRLCWKKRRFAFVAMCFIFLTSSLGNLEPHHLRAPLTYAFSMCQGASPTTQTYPNIPKHQVWIAIPLSIRFY